MILCLLAELDVGWHISDQKSVTQVSMPGCLSNPKSNVTLFKYIDGLLPIPLVMYSNMKLMTLSSNGIRTQFVKVMLTALVEYQITYMTCHKTTVGTFWKTACNLVCLHPHYSSLSHFRCGGVSHEFNCFQKFQLHLNQP